MTKTRRLFGSLCASFLISISLGTAAWASQQIFLCIPGQPGGATEKGFEDCIEVLSYSQDFKASSKACHISFLKVFGPSSGDFAFQAVTREFISEGTFFFVEMSDVPRTVLEIYFTNWRVRTVEGNADSNGGDNVMTETIRMRYTSSASLTLTRFPAGGAPETTNINCG